MRSAIYKLFALAVLATLLQCSASQPPKTNFRPGNLKVDVSPVQSTYSVWVNGRLSYQDNGTNAFCVRFHVSNLDPKPSAVGVMTCSYFQHWKTDNADVSVGGWGCDSNFPEWHALTSTNVYTQQLPLVVRPAAKGRELRLHLIFTPYAKHVYGPVPSGAKVLYGGNYESNELTIKVVD